MSTLATNAITDASGGNTTTINGYTPTMSNMAGRNRIINGDMRIDQRNAGASVDAANTGTSYYFVDRWAYIISAVSKFTLQQSSDAPAGFNTSLLITSSSAYSSSASAYINIRQMIEGYNVSDFGWGTANAKTVTLSFWAKSSLTGSFSGSLQNSAFDRSYPFTYTISSANTWEYKTVTISGDTTGTWLTDSNIGVRINFNIGSGSNYLGTADAWSSSNLRGVTGTTSLIATSGATLYITGVQLEEGSVATPFEHRQYGQELALCQRYYWAMTQTVYACVYSTSNCMGHIWFPTTMRANPTVVSVLGGGGTLNSEYINPHYYGWYITGDTTTNCSDIKATAEL